MNGRLLYVEDDMVLAGVTCRALSKRGISFDHFESLAQTKRALEHQEYARALLDLKLEDEGPTGSWKYPPKLS